MTIEEKRKFYSERIVECEHLIHIGANPIRWMNHKKKWEYKLKILERDELV